MFIPTFSAFFVLRRAELQLAVHVLFIITVSALKLQGF